MSEYLKLQIAVLISNVITLSLWVILAIAFNKWWVIFFSIFFFNNIKTNKEWLNDRWKTWRRVIENIWEKI